jgi:hypothetical protein
VDRSHAGLDPAGSNVRHDADRTGAGSRLPRVIEHSVRAGSARGEGLLVRGCESLWLDLRMDARGQRAPATPALPVRQRGPRHSRTPCPTHADRLDQRTRWIEPHLRCATRASTAATAGGCAPGFDRHAAPRGGARPVRGSDQRHDRHDVDRDPSSIVTPRESVAEQCGAPMAIQQRVSCRRPGPPVGPSRNLVRQSRRLRRDAAVAAAHQPARHSLGRARRRPGRVGLPGGST